MDDQYENTMIPPAKTPTTESAICSICVFNTGKFKKISVTTSVVMAIAKAGRATRTYAAIDRAATIDSETAIKLDQPAITSNVDCAVAEKSKPGKPWPHRVDLAVREQEPQ